MSREHNKRLGCLEPNFVGGTAAQIETNREVYTLLATRAAVRARQRETAKCQQTLNGDKLGQCEAPLVTSGRLPQLTANRYTERTRQDCCLIDPMPPFCVVSRSIHYLFDGVMAKSKKKPQ